MCRAIESEREDCLFHDPYARRLAGPDAEQLAQKLIGGGRLPDVMAIRTKAIDDFILKLIDKHGVDLVISLGAGLDTRPYRLSLPAELRWVEVDLPKMINYKEQQLHGVAPRCLLERYALDLGDRNQRSPFFSTVTKNSKKGLVLTEGLLYYLHPTAVAELAADLHKEPVMRFWITDIVSRVQLTLLMLFWGQAFGSAQMVFAPDDGIKTFAEWGYAQVESIGMVRYGLELRRLSRLAKLLPKKALHLLLSPPRVREVVDSQAQVLLLERFSMV
jgi:methyltransferase (TIGR00027 family)